MESTRDLKRDLLGVLFSLATLFIGASLTSYDPADPPSTIVYPLNESVENWCGPLGASLAWHSVDWFGPAAFGLCLLTTLFAVGCFRRHSIVDLARRASGVILCMIVVAAFLSRTGSTPPWLSVAGNGGMVGLLLGRMLEENVSLVGSLMILGIALLCGLMLACDQLVMMGGHWLRTTGLGLLQLGQRLLAGIAFRFLLIARGLVMLLLDRLARLRPSLGTPKSASTGQAAFTPAVAAPTNAAPQEGTVAKTPSTWMKPKESKPVTSTLASLLSFSTAENSLPDLAILDEPESVDESKRDETVLAQGEMLKSVFAEFNMEIEVVEWHTGPVITQFEIALPPGLRTSKVKGLSDDVARAMKATTVRIVAPIPGKNTVGVEVPNEDRVTVRIRALIEETTAASNKMRLPLFIGEDVKGDALVYDLAKMPHLLIAGRTGTGKSVCLNALILSILLTRTPEQVRLLMIDPKMVELSLYKDIPHLMHPVVTDMKKAEALLGWAVDKMEERYTLLSSVGVRHIDGYNKLTPEERLQRVGPLDDDSPTRLPDHLPYILIFADEMADLMMTAPKEVESHIIRLAQKSRAVGIHLILATQKPTVDVITGLIKSNLPARIAFQVASRSDSRVVLDEMGADKLLGNGDMLFLVPGTSNLMRAQGTFVSDDEVTRVVEFLKQQPTPENGEGPIDLDARTDEPIDTGEVQNLSDRDPLYEQAVDVIINAQRGSVSLLQRALGIGYGRGARLIDFMAEDGIVGEYNGSQAREVLYSPEDWAQAREHLFSNAG
ncbi:DNA translocase FtsK [Planctomycetes bacterium Pan216]|uniref:DNA translocase FtsK n=1 Tax=Kolteria novifilia TaxID=2527975 RepID=A0A518B865_9BACT|nr:DNA translocase FtsK [Planctomycetes bacterium Pan216]